MSFFNKDIDNIELNELYKDIYAILNNPLRTVKDKNRTIKNKRLKINKEINALISVPSYLVIPNAYGTIFALQGKLKKAKQLRPKLKLSDVIPTRTVRQIKNLLHTHWDSLTQEEEFTEFLLIYYHEHRKNS